MVARLLAVPMPGQVLGQSVLVEILPWERGGTIAPARGGQDKADGYHHPHPPHGHGHGAGAVQ